MAFTGQLGSSESMLANIVLAGLLETGSIRSRLAAQRMVQRLITRVAWEEYTRSIADGRTRYRHWDLLKASAEIRAATERAMMEEHQQGLQDLATLVVLTEL